MSDFILRFQFGYKKNVNSIKAQIWWATGPTLSKVKKKKNKKKKTGRMISSRHGTSTKAAKLDQCDQWRLFEAQIKAFV